MPEIILFDDKCGLCRHFVMSVIDQDPGRIFQFAPLKSPAGLKLLDKYGIKRDINSVVLVTDGHTYVRSKAVLRILQRLGNRSVYTAILRWAPTPVADLGYRMVAVGRKYISCRNLCPVLSEDARSRFALDS